MAVITTSRGASRDTINLARILTLLLPNSHFERRGNKSIETLVETGRKKGHSRIILISEKDGKPAKLHFISLNEFDWEWLPIEFDITGFKISKHLLPVESLHGPHELAELFEFEPEEGDVLIEEMSNKLVFKRDEDIMLELKVRKRGIET